MAVWSLNLGQVEDNECACSSLKKSSEEEKTARERQFVIRSTEIVSRRFVLVFMSYNLSHLSKTLFSPNGDQSKLRVFCLSSIV